MLLPRETELARRLRVTVSELQAALSRKDGSKAPNHIMTGTLVGAGTGVLVGVGAMLGLPVVEAMATAGGTAMLANNLNVGTALATSGYSLDAGNLTVPLVLGSFAAGIGMIGGAFAEMAPISTIWKHDQE